MKRWSLGVGLTLFVLFYYEVKNLCKVNIKFENGGIHENGVVD